MTETLNYDFKILLNPNEVCLFEEALSEIAGAVLTVMIEKGPNKGMWELQAIFEGKPDEAELLTLIQRTADAIQIQTPQINLQKMENKNWLLECYQSFKPITIGKYFIYGSHIDEIPQDKIALQIDAATAFGTGEHQTTHGCLDALNDLDFKPEKVIDVGCGSGILSMAYAKTFNKKVDAVDIDPESVRVATENAKINNVDHLMTVWHSDGYKQVNETYDLVLCNILARPLMDMAPDLKEHLNPKGVAILSGFLNRQERWVLKAHTDIGFKFLKRYRVKGWSTLVLQKED